MANAAANWTEDRVWDAVDKATRDTIEASLALGSKVPDRLTIVHLGAKYMNNTKGNLDGGMTLFMSKKMRDVWEEELKITMDTNGNYCYRQFSFPHTMAGKPFEIPRRYFPSSPLFLFTF